MKRTLLALACLLWATGLLFGQNPTITSVLPGFGQGTVLCPGILSKITGTNFGSNVSVTVGGKPAYMNGQPPSSGATAGTTASIQLPFDAATGPQTLVLTRTSDQATVSFQITLSAAAPALVNAQTGITTPNGVIISPRHADGTAVTAANTAKAGETISFAAIGLGPTSPPLTAGTKAVGTETITNTLAMSIGTTSIPSANLTASAAAGQIGYYTVKVVIPGGINGTLPATITVAGQTSSSIPLAAGAIAAPVITNITDAAGGSGFCPGGQAIITGTGLGPNPSVQVGGKTAYNISINANATSLTIQIPVDAPLGTDNVVVTLGTATPPFPITVAQFAPVLPFNGAVGPNAARGFHIPSGAQITTAAPVVPGEQIGITVFGLGPTNPPLTTGQVSPNNTQIVTTTQPTVSVGGKPASVIGGFAQPGAVATYFVTFTVPAGLAGGDVDVTVSIGGFTSNARTIPVSTAPFITSVVNAASGILPGLPNSGIAQGAIFLVIGSLLGPDAIAIDPNPFQKTDLSGTSLSVTVAGTTVSPLMYYTQAGQVAALLPSNTPTGTGTIKATYNGQTGASFPITVVANNLGIFTVTSNGTGAGVVTYPDYSLVSTFKGANCGGVYTTCGAANPGDVLILWGTGLGPVNGKDEAGAGLGVNQTDVPLKIWVGGVQANIAYQGRSGCCIGEDQIVFTVPPDAPTGCAVPLVAQINDQISNGVAIPIAASGRTCTPANPAFGTAASVPTLGAVPVRYADIELVRRDNNPFQDIARADFGTGTVPAQNVPFSMSGLDVPPLGTCAVYNRLGGQTDPPLDNTQGLDAGTTMTVKGPGGTVDVQSSGSSFRTTLSSGFLVPGSYTISFSGGKDVPAFSTNVTLPNLPVMTSPPPDVSNTPSVTRSDGMQVTWAGGSAGSVVQLAGKSSIDNMFVTGASFQCMVSADAGTFTIPPYVLMAMPAGNFGSLNFQPGPVPVSIAAPGLNLAFFQSSFDYIAKLIFK
jgi:uncharacterized protein (TIGR03437 family)